MKTNHNNEELAWAMVGVLRTAFFVLSTVSFGEAFIVFDSHRLRQSQPCIASRWLLVKNSVADVPAQAIERELSALGSINATVQIISSDPLIYRVYNLLSLEECRAYQAYVADRNMTRSNPPLVSLEVSKLWPLPFLALGAGLPPYMKLVSGDYVSLETVLRAVLPNVIGAICTMGILAWFVILPILRKVSKSSSRTSVAVALNQEGSDMEFCRALVHRASAAASAHPWNQWEAPVVTRYDPGAIFARHGDASPTGGSEWKDNGGQRVVTCIGYLNTLDNAGGETYFDQLDVAVQPVAGSALFFFPADATTWKADDRTTHESLTATEEKWIVQLFGRAERVPPPLGLPSSFGDLPKSPT